MRILLSNDDGIQAPGIHALHGAVKDLGEVHVVAPDVVDDVPEYWIVLSPLCGRLQ